MRRRRVLPQVAAFVLLIVLALLLAGCWNRRDIDTLAIVTAAGVDFDEQTNEIKLTVHALRAEVLGETAPDLRPYVQRQSTGRTVFEAVRNTIQQSPARMFWAHNPVIVVGEQTARNGLMPVMDYFIRDGETRLDVLLLVARGTTANEVLKVDYGVERLPGIAVVDHLRSARQSLSTGVFSDLNDFLIRWESPGIQPLAARIERVVLQPGDPSGQLTHEERIQDVYIGGAAAFIDDRLVGWLEPLEVRGVYWLRGETRGGILVVPDPWQADRNIGLELSRSSSRVEFSETETGGITCKVRISSTAYLGDAMVFRDPLSMEHFVTAVQTAMEAEIENEVRTALDRCQQELGSDVFGLGAMLSRKNPALWVRVKDNWPAVFAALDVEVEVKGRILRAGSNIRYGPGLVR